MTIESKYMPWMCQKIVEIAADGGHVADMFCAIGVGSKETFYRWIQDYPEFSEAYSAAKLMSEVYYTTLLRKGAEGKIKNYNFNSVAMILNNKFPDEYKRTVSGSNTEVNIGSINSIESLGTDELDKKLIALQKQLKALKVLPHDE